MLHTVMVKDHDTFCQKKINIERELKCIPLVAMNLKGLGNTPLVLLS